MLSRLYVAIIQSWYQREGYVKSMADLIQKELQSFGSPEEVMIFFSAHGVPKTYVRDAGDQSVLRLSNFKRSGSKSSSY
ncbi:ferrochelatase-2, chloroplastic-like protein [Tanacetum coccineum]